MDPLPPIRLFASPELRPPPLPDAGAPAPIPAGELQTLGDTGALPPAAPAAEASRSFGALFSQLVGEVNAKQAAAGEAVGALLSGQNASLHQAMIAMEEASVSFQLMVEVRNKLLESYQELMRMQV
jgi:flagellar hook-basal body complex protein FliE